MSMRMFWVLTLSYATARGPANHTLSSVAEFAPGTTRQDAFRAIYRDASELAGADRPTVLFFSLEPNDLEV